jgi:hypothetical protein
MPLLRYFVGVGACLAAIMLLLNVLIPSAEVAPNMATADSGGSTFDRTTIRISATPNTMQPVVIDTSLPTIIPVQRTIVQANASPVSKKVRDAYAQVPKIEPAVKPKKKVVAVRHKPRDPMMPTFEAPHVAGLFGSW